MLKKIFSQDGINELEKLVFISFKKARLTWKWCLSLYNQVGFCMNREKFAEHVFPYLNILM